MVLAVAPSWFVGTRIPTVIRTVIVIAVLLQACNQPAAKPQPGSAPTSVGEVQGPQQRQVPIVVTPPGRAR